MHAYRHHCRQVRFADDDCDLVALGHAPAEHREGGHADVAQRHRRTGDQFVIVGGVCRALGQVAQRHFGRTRKGRVLRIQAHRHHRRQQQAQAGQLHRAGIEGVAGTPVFGHRAGFAQVAQRGQGIEGDAGQGQACALRSLHAEHAGAGGGQEQVMALACSTGERGEAAGRGAVQRDHGQALALAVVEQHRATGTQFGHRAFAADRGGVAEQGRGSSHGRTGGGGHRSLYGGSGVVFNVVRPPVAGDRTAVNADVLRSRTGLPRRCPGAAACSACRSTGTAPGRDGRCARCRH